MNVTINIVELASELASYELEQSREIGQINTIEDEHGCIVYIEETQDFFNDLYDRYYAIVENTQIKP
jgi:hypothetical protein